MFKKVLIVDDHDDINSGVRTVLNNMGILKIDKAQYCDDAYLKIKKAHLEDDHYDLIITDLSFKKDYRDCSIQSGEQLIAAVKTEQPQLPVIVYSMDNRLQKVRGLISKHHINAYVCKDRKGSAELAQAITAVYNNTIYLSPQVSNALSDKADLEIEDYDIELIKQLANGRSQEEISDYFKQNNKTPNSLSSIEKKLNKLRIQFKANNAIHLVAIVKDLGLI
ncbi:response regulator transcription factor [Gelidibacter salicanalis]|uniref:Response regulator transcription factor n=2 Tax=Gelidibacter salicanalis TaxID=291193 RepID=A0A5C7AQP5_9FLAO|nr:response regulator transcription factor [Gelidibacter salicanalis]